MQLVFCKTYGTAAPAPAHAEIHVRAPHGGCGPLGLARLVFERGATALAHGPGAPQLLVVPADPTLDDMLAASFAQHLLAGKELPAGAKRFADYAALAREGLEPGDVSPEQSLEGLFLAVRNAHGADLSDALVGARFAEAWARLARLILRAAEAGQDPFRIALFVDESDLARERAFLEDDHEVFRQDVQRGEEWLVHLPDGPPRGCALLLRQPRSLLFKHWARRAKEGPLGKPYLFLAVDWGEGLGPRWVFSTAPVDRLRIKSLADRLNAAEQARNPRCDPNDLWFDGARFDYTLVASPRQGTVLSEKEVLRIVRRWSRPRSRKKQVLACLCLGALLVLLLGWWLVPVPLPKELSRRIIEPGARLSAALNGHALARGVELRDEEENWVGSRPLTVELRPGPNDVVFLAEDVFAANQPVQVRVGVRPLAPAALGAVRVAVNGGPDQTLKLAPAATEAGVLESTTVSAIFRGRANHVRIALANPTPNSLRVEVSLSWGLDSTYKSSLYVLAVGVSKYRGPRLELKYADKDALDLVEALRGQRDGVFKAVHVYQGGALTNEKATKESVLKGLEWLANSMTQHDLAIVTLAGHGNKHSASDYYFMPYDFDESKSAAVTGLFWADFDRELVRSAPGKIIIVLDTCHSGQVTREMRDAITPEQEVTEAVRSFARADRGLVVIAGSMSNGLAEERAAWGHGALTLALLEAVTGRYHCTKSQPTSELTKLGLGRIISLKDVDYYVTKRVHELTKGRQAVVTRPTGNLSLDDFKFRVPPR